MQSSERGSATLNLVVILAGLALALGNILLLSLMLKGTADTAGLQALLQQNAPQAAFFALAPLFLAGLAIALAGRGSAATTAPKAAPEAPRPPDLTPALQLLGLLQQEGRLVDFLEEDISTYDDTQVGGAVRTIHAGCRKALRERIRLERVFDKDEGATVTVDPGFDPAAVRLIGNVAGTPPFRGTLQHAGWRVIAIDLPQATGGSPNVIAPAEVEIA